MALDVIQRVVAANSRHEGTIVLYTSRVTHYVNTAPATQDIPLASGRGSIPATGLLYYTETWLDGRFDNKGYY